MAQQETIRIPAYYVPRPEQIEFWKAYHSGIRFFDLCWHRREGKDFTALNATVEEILTKRPGLAWHLFPTLAQGRKVLWDATDNQGRPLTSAFPKQLVTEVNKADMRIKCKYVPDIAEGRKEVRESTWQIVGADNPDSLRGANPVIVVISEFGDIPPNLWYEIIQPILFANGGKAIFVWTPKGRNHAYTLHCAAKESMNDPDVPPEFKWFSQELTVDDTHKWVYENGEEAGIPSKELIDSGKVKCVPVVSPEAVEEARKQGMDEAVLQQEFYCMPGNALVATVSGQSPIEEIRVGDFVLTHTGRMRKVLETMQRQYDGDMIHIKSYGSSDELVLTPNHAVRVYDRATASYTWIPAGELTTDHRITFPRRPTGVRTVDKAFVTLLCWYITEGSCAKNAVQFTLGENETANIKQITKAAKKLGYEVKILHRVEDHTKNVVVCSTALADQLATICGSKAHNKRIPFEWIAGYEQEVLAMLLAGDGCVVNSDSKYPWYMYSTVSEDLAYGIQQLAISVGKRAGISRQEPVQEIMGRKIKEPHARFNVQIRDCNHSKTDVKHLDIAKYCMHARIQSITREHYEGTVYNLKVQYDESYVANGRVVHNCSFNAALKGAYFGDQMNEAVRDGRINNNILHNPSYPVYTGWDLGMNDTMDIVFAQIIDDQIKIIDFYENNGKGLEHYIQYINSKPYTYAYHFGPHDLKVRELGAGSRLEFARKLGLRFTVIPRVSAKEDSINAARAILNRCFFNMTKCHDLIEALKCYTKRWDEKRQIYMDTPLHDKNSNACLVAGTKIKMVDGTEKCIEDIVIGDEVWISDNASAPVVASGCTGVHPTYEVTLKDGKHIELTGNHKIFTTRGLVRTDALQYDDHVDNTEEQIWTNLLNKSTSLRDDVTSFGRVLNGGCGKIKTTTMYHSAGDEAKQKSCKESCLDSQIDTHKCTQKTGTCETCHSTTLLHADWEQEIMQEQSVQTTSNTMTNASTPSERDTGIPKCTASYTDMYGHSTTDLFHTGIQYITLTWTRITTALRTCSACLIQNILSCMGKPTSGLAQQETENILLKSDIKQAYGTHHQKAEHGTESMPENTTSDTTTTGNILKKDVRSAKKMAGNLASVQSTGKTKPVYNITVADHHCYYANGILVSNCDAMQTLAMGLSMYPQAMKKMKMRETEDGYLLEKVDNSRGDDRYDLYNYDRY